MEVTELLSISGGAISGKGGGRESLSATGGTLLLAAGGRKGELETFVCLAGAEGACWGELCAGEGACCLDGVVGVASVSFFLWSASGFFLEDAALLTLGVP